MRSPTASARRSAARPGEPAPAPERAHLPDLTPTPLPVRLFRAGRLALHLVSGVLQVALFFPFCAKDLRDHAVARWSARLLGILNVRAVVTGGPPRSPGRHAVLVANHVSWLDIQLIHSVWQVRFVAKSEVRRWPVIGWLSARVGTLFIRRGRGRHAARINEAIHEAFRRGDAIGVFPEGTTSDGSELTRFHASLLQPAVDEDALVYPAALRYLDAAGNVCRQASYVGDASLLESMRMIFRQRTIVAELRFLPAIDAVGRTRRELAAAAQAVIAEALNLRVSDRKPEIAADPRDARR
ncbi:MAG TPA: lysophospholipid acyltransferase family protein [Burkholderiales bacterium]|nr:lysophospholipid acyltransferase family protein [Burkholderiales bacterium]